MYPHTTLNYTPITKLNRTWHAERGGEEGHGARLRHWTPAVACEPRAVRTRKGFSRDSPTVLWDALAMTVRDSFTCHKPVIFLKKINKATRTVEFVT